MTNKREEHVYELPPIDNFGTLGWTPHAASGGDAHLDEAVVRALSVIATSPLYETEWREPNPYWMRLPSEDYEPGAYAVALKIDNNGTTFVWAPCALPWLSEYLSLTPGAIAAQHHAEDGGG
jgi:hypothetical protein